MPMMQRECNECHPGSGDWSCSCSWRVGRHQTLETEVAQNHHADGQHDDGNGRHDDGGSTLNEIHLIFRFSFRQPRRPRHDLEDSVSEGGGGG